MGDIKLADFGIGIDARRSSSTSNPKSFRDIENCFITTGHTLKKRGGFKHVATMPADTAGLSSYNDELHTFRVSKGIALQGNPNDGTTALPPLLAAPLAINGDTTPIVIDVIERVHNIGIANTVAQSAEQIYPCDIRRIHFSDTFSASQYIIAEHWNGEITHHYLNDGILSDRVSTWGLYVGSDNNWVEPTSYPSVPFIFHIKGSEPDLITEPFWGLQNWANREADVWNTIQNEASALFSIANDKTVVDAYADTLYLAFHDGGLALGNTFISLDGIWQPQIPLLSNLIKSTHIVNGVQATFAENEGAQSIYITTRDELLAQLSILESLSTNFGSTVQNKVSDLKAILNDATKEYKRRRIAFDKMTFPHQPVKLTKERKYLKEGKDAMDTARNVLNSYVAANHADENIDVNLDAVLALARWKTYNYIALIATTLANNAPPLALGDHVWTTPKETLLGTVTTITNSIAAGDVYAVAADPNSIGYTQIKDKDLNQNSTVALNIASKMYVADQQYVRHSQTSDPTKWLFDPQDENLDTGYLDVGLYQSGSGIVTGLGQHLGKMLVTFDDAAQIWNVDPDPNFITFKQTVEGLGTSHKHSISNVSNEAIILHRTGFRSIAAMQYNNNLTDTDIGSAVDNPVVQHLANAALRQDVDTSLLTGAVIDLATVNATPVIGIAVHTLGQYWCAIGKAIWVYSYSRLAKVSGWSHYSLPFEVEAIVELKGVVYIRSGTHVYAYDPAKIEDDIDFTLGTTAPILGSATFQFLTGRAAGRMKMFHSFDSIIVGTANMRFQFDARNPQIETADLPLTGDSNPSYLTPMQVSSTHIAPIIESLEPFELEYIALYFNMLGRR